MTPSDRENMQRVWDQWRDRYLDTVLQTPGHRMTIVAFEAPAGFYHPSVVPAQEYRHFTFEMRFGCLSNWEVWDVTCEGELVEYGV